MQDCHSLPEHFRTLVGLLTLSALVLPGVRQASAAEGDDPPQVDSKVVRCCVIGGMVRTNLWRDVSALFEQETGIKVVVVRTGQRPMLDETFREGKADLLTMHSGDVTTNLVADGLATNMRPWARNDLVIAGPPSDPAGIRGMENAVEAVKKIYEAKANWVDSKGMGPREVAHQLFGAAEIVTEGDWFIKDESGDHLNILNFAEQHNAYVIVGRSPMVQGKIRNNNMEIMVDQAPEMRRPYIVMEANPALIPGVNAEGARLLADFLLGEKAQTLLKEHGTDKYGGFHPVVTTPPADEPAAPADQ